MTAVLAVLLVPGAVVLILGTLLLGTLGGEVASLAAVEVGLCSSFPSTSNCSSVTDTREDKQKPPREGLELAPELPTRAIDLEAEASA